MRSTYQHLSRKGFVLGLETGSECCAALLVAKCIHPHTTCSSFLMFRLFGRIIFSSVNLSRDAFLEDSAGPVSAE